MTTYSIAEFHDGLQIVPSSWLRENKTKSLWPKYTNPDRINKAVIGGEKPDEKTWLLLNVRIFGSADKYEAAVYKLNLAKQVSDIDTASGADESCAKKSRHTRAKRVISPSNSTSEADQDSDAEIEDRRTKKLPPPPKKPKAISPQKTAVQQAGHSNSDSEEDFPSTQITSRDSTTADRPEIHCKQSTNQKKKDSNVDLQLRDVSCASISYKESFATGSRQRQSREHETPHLSADVEFKKEVLRKLNAIIYKMRAMDEKLDFVLKDNNQKCIESSATHLESEEDSINFPVSSEEEFETVEKFLADKIKFKQEVNRLKQLGGAEVHGSTLTILKRLLADEVAQHYSWVGSRGNKRSFKDKNLCRLLISTVRANYSEATDKAIESTVSKWLKLAQSSFRLKRAQERRLRKQQNVGAGAEIADSVDDLNE